MLKELFITMAGISKSEFNIMLKSGTIKLVNGDIWVGDLIVVKSDTNIDMKRYSFNEDKIKTIVSLFHADILESKSKSLIGVEIKRPCQYDREWISDINITNHPKREILIFSTSGKVYHPDKVKLYNTEDGYCTIYKYIADLIMEEMVEIKTN